MDEPPPPTASADREAAPLLKASATTPPAALAGAIAGTVRNHQHAEVQALGAGAVNQTVKAIVIAKGHLQGNGIDIVFVPRFVNLVIDGEERSAIRFVIDLRPQ